jgi:hypothetical protein
MSLVTPGLRTAAQPGWRAGVATAISVAVGEPRLWLLGALGFTARGGLLFLALPIVTVPSPIVLSTIFRGQLSAIGPTDGATIGLLIALAGASILGALALVAAAYADVAAFELLAEDPDTENLRTDRQPARFGGRERAGLVLALAAIQAVALIPAVIVGALIAGRIEQVLLQELILPSSFAEPLFVRVIGAVSMPLVALAVALLAADLVYTLAGRAVLVTRAGLDGVRGTRRTTGSSAVAGALRVVTRPGRTVATAIVAWPVTIVVLTPVVWAAAVAWTGVRNVFLSPAGLSDADAFPGAVTVIVIFAAIWVAAMILAGVASAVRAALWSADALR